MLKSHKSSSHKFSSLTPATIKWEVFVAAYNIAVAQDGELYKGYARAGKLGSKKLPINSLEGYLAHTIHGVSEGGSVFSPGFVVAAILDWVGVFINERGSIVKLDTQNMCISSYSEVLHNAETFISGLDDSVTVKNSLSFF